MLARPGQRETVEALRQCLQEGNAAARTEFSSGFEGDLPRTFRRGTLVEYLAESGSGATTLALATAREACREGGALVVVDRSRTFYPPAAASFGFNHNAIFIRPHSRKDELWALNQTLRCPGVGAMLAWPDELEERVFRGLQIAAENGGSVGLFIRPTKVRGLPTWSDVQLLVESLSSEKRRRLRIEVVKSRCGHEGASAMLELDDETGTLQISRLMPLAAELASAANAARPARA